MYNNYNNNRSDIDTIKQTDTIEKDTISFGFGYRFYVVLCVTHMVKSTRFCIIIIIIIIARSVKLIMFIVMMVMYGVAVYDVNVDRKEL